jgi:hypothetical protein
MTSGQYNARSAVYGIRICARLSVCEIDVIGIWKEWSVPDSSKEDEDIVKA